jgi:hypothetical protein
LKIKKAVISEKPAKVRESIQSGRLKEPQSKSTKIEKAIVIDENTVEVVWENRDMYDKLLALI